MTTDAAGVGTWQNAPTLALPYTGVSSSTATASSIEKTGVYGRAMLVRTDNPSNANVTFEVYTNGTGPPLRATGTYAGEFNGKLYGNGKMGIGTSSPDEALNIAGSLKVDQNDTNNGDFTSGATKFGSGNTGEGIASKRTTGGNWAGLDFYTGYANRMTIQNGGNVGIGTITPSQKSVPALVHGYSLERSVISSGGGNSTSASYQLNATVGQPLAGFANNTDMLHWIGFWAGDVRTPVVVSSIASAKRLADGSFVSRVTAVEPGYALIDDGSGPVRIDTTTLASPIYRDSYISVIGISSLHANSAKIDRLVLPRGDKDISAR